jgi:hypothetical protein
MRALGYMLIVGWNVQHDNWFTAGLMPVIWTAIALPFEREK